MSPTGSKAGARKTARGFGLWESHGVPMDETAGDAQGADADSARVRQLRPSDLAEHVLTAVADLGGEAQRVEIIDRALQLGDWTPEELAVRAEYVAADAAAADVAQETAIKTATTKRRKNAGRLTVSASHRTPPDRVRRGPRNAGYGRSVTVKPNAKIMSSVKLTGITARAEHGGLAVRCPPRGQRCARPR